jgi:DNA-binding NarL/FixJ family response regulator
MSKVLRTFPYLTRTTDSVILINPMNAPDVKIIVVDNFKPWRRRVCTILENHPEWKIVSEASDGAEAVEKAIELQPDLILLDVGLPVLDGIKAAKIISQKCPRSRIIFLTQCDDCDIREAAREAGAACYLLKSKAASDLVNVISRTLNHP